MSERGARLEVPGACNGLSADGGKPQQQAPREVFTALVEHGAAEPTAKPKGPALTRVDQLTMPVERRCPLEVFLSHQKSLYCPTDVHFVGWETSILKPRSLLGVQARENMNVMACSVLPVIELIFFKCLLMEPLDLATQEHQRKQTKSNASLFRYKYKTHSGSG